MSELNAHITWPEKPSGALAEASRLYPGGLHTGYVSLDLPLDATTRAAIYAKADHFALLGSGGAVVDTFDTVAEAVAAREGK